MGPQDDDGVRAADEHGAMTTSATLPVDGGHTGRRVHHCDTALSVLSGVVYLVAGDDELVLTPGDSATVPAGVEHRYWNAGDDEACVIVRSVPAAVGLPRAA